MAQIDQFGRPLRTLRLSLTDRCNLRCEYCMPEAEYAWLPREDLLSLDEVTRLVGVFAGLGVRRLRLTGGEPLLRPDLPELVRRLARDCQLEDLALTTNGVLLADAALELRRAGLRRLTVSLDTLAADRFAALARGDRHARVLEGIAAAARARFEQLKIDAVILRGHNDDELVPLLEFGRRHGAEVRFIEYMDVPGATRWAPERLFSRTSMLERIAAGKGQPKPVGKDSPAPADRYRLPDGSAFGIIASTTAPFCRACDRSRLTADGHWFLCLYADAGVDLRTPLRAGESDADLAARLSRAWNARRDLGAEDRLQLADRRALVTLEALRRNPHREMHTRGG